MSSARGGNAPLHHEVFVSGLEPIRGEPLPDGTRRHWSPLSHTLVFGPTTAAVVDPPITVAQTDALANWIAAHERRLEFVYVTHWHGDHWFGTAQLLRRFPGAVALATPATIARITASIPAGKVSDLWRASFGDTIADVSGGVPLVQMPAGGIEIDGHLLESIEVGHSDTDDSTVLHVPSTGVVVAGDVVYNNVHQHLGESAGGGIGAWHAALDAVGALAPTAVVAGHKDPTRPDSPTDIDATHRYLDRVSGIAERASTRRDFYLAVRDAYPDRVNPYTIWLTARGLFAE